MTEGPEDKVVEVDMGLIMREVGNVSETCCPCQKRGTMSPPETPGPSNSFTERGVVCTFPLLILLIYSCFTCTVWCPYGSTSGSGGGYTTVNADRQGDPSRRSPGVSLGTSTPW